MAVLPHTINYIKVSEFLGKKVLGACMDDGLIQIWYVETILEQIQRFKNKSNVTNNDGIEEVRVEIRRDDTAASIVESVVSREELERNQRDRELTPGSTDDDELSSQFIYLTNRFFGLKIKPEFTLKMGSSCWGLDFLPSHNMLVASDNCQNITLFYYDPYDERFYHVATHQLLHNIPEVAFLDQTDDDDNKVRVSCSSISGEILIFEFGFTHVSGPLNFEDFDVFRNEKIYCIDPGMISLSVSINNNISDVQRSLRFSRISWDTPKVIRRVLLGEDCWTCKPIAANYFKPVQSIRAMIGDPWLDEDSEIREILRESKILNREYDPIRTSHLGAGAKWQFFEASVLKLEEGTNYEDSELFESATLTGIDDTYRRIKKGILREEKVSTKVQRQTQSHLMVGNILIR